MNMSDDEKKELEELVDNNITSIDKGRLNKLKKKGHYFSMLERFDVLQIKFIYDTLTKEEATQFITYIKYFMENGHSEAFRLRCYYIHKKYIEKQGL